ncbi:hypothetical protein [Streptomyces sp. SA15]|uniref:hypothetical protein n=1 Tax=Streptomyces sp. SA15 TaxID=934019 RepID=UPI0015C93519|nr:hypothetical protein [Streptomyces sp. SA15]
MTRIAIEITVDISDLATEDEADEIRARIEEATAEWKPTVTATTREYGSHA